MTDTAFGTTLDRLPENDLLPIIQLLTDDQMDKEAMILRIVDFAFDKGIRTFLQALKKEQIQKFLQDSGLTFNPEDDRRELKRQVYHRVEEIGLTEILLRQSTESLQEYAHILQFDLNSNTKDEMADEINTEIINLGATYILSNLNLEELQVMSKRLNIQTKDLEKDDLIVLILNPVQEKKNEPEQDLLANETDQVGEYAFINCLKPKSMGYTEFEKFLVMKTRQDYLYCYIKIVEFKGSNGESVEKAQYIFDEYLGDKAIHELNILDEFKESIKNSLDKKVFKPGMFREIEKFIISDLKESHRAFLNIRIQSSLHLDRVTGENTSSAGPKRVARTHSADLDIKPVVCDITPGSSPRGEQEAPVVVQSRVKHVPELFTSKEFSEISNEINKVDPIIVKTPESNTIPSRESTGKDTVQSGKVTPLVTPIKPLVKIQVDDSKQRVSRGHQFAPVDKNQIELSQYFLTDWKTIKELVVDEKSTEYGTEGKEPEIKAATITKLVDAATHYAQNDPGNNYLFCFVLTYKSFITSTALLDMLISLFYTPPHQDIKQEEVVEFTSVTLTRTRLRIVKFIRYWIERQFQDFDTDLMKKLENLIVDMKKTKAEYFASIIETTIRKTRQTMAMQQRKSNSTTLNDKIPAPILPRSKAESEDFFLWPEKEIARQITLVEYEIFKKISPQELLNKNFSPENRKEKAPNVDFLMNWFNKFSSWISYKILERKEPSDRVKVLSKVIKVASECKSLGNLNGAFELISATTTTPIHRLTRTWALLSRRTRGMYDDLSQYFTANHNFKQLRSLTQNLNPPAIPYIGTYLRDLMYIDDVHPNESNGKINFNKRRQIGVLIREIQQFCAPEMYIYPVAFLKNILSGVKQYDDAELIKISLEKEKKEAKKSLINIPFFSSPESSLSPLLKPLQSPTPGIINPITKRKNTMDVGSLSARTDSSVTSRTDTVNSFTHRSPEVTNLTQKSNSSGAMSTRYDSSGKTISYDINVQKVVNDSKRSAPTTPTTPSSTFGEKVEVQTPKLQGTPSNEGILTPGLNLPHLESSPQMQSETTEDMKNLSKSNDEEVAKLKKEIELLKKKNVVAEALQEKYNSLKEEHGELLDYVEKLEVKVTEYREARNALKATIIELTEVADTESLRYDKFKQKVQKIATLDDRIEAIEKKLGIDQVDGEDIEDILSELEKKSKDYVTMKEKMNSQYTDFGTKL